MNDIRNLLNILEIQIQPEENNKTSTKDWVNINCPFCFDKKFHGGINIEKFYYNCFKCGWKKIDEALAASSNKNINQIRFLLKNTERKYNKEIKKEENKNTILKIPEIEKLNFKAKSYLKNRNFDPDILEKKYHFSQTNHIGIYSFRIFIPIFFKGEIVTYQCRDYTENQQPRYMACKKEDEILNIKDVLYNVDNCRKDSVIITEGIFDCIRFGDDCCCTFGIDFSINQVRIIVNRFKKAFIVYDNEENAQFQAEKLAFILNGFNIKSETIQLENVKDPAELSQEKANKIKYEILK